jgi:polysaccharide export outer membrane protein
MKKITIRLTTLASLSVLLFSCATSKKILYLQDIEGSKHLQALHSYESTIKKDDKLNIVVSAPNKEVVMPYNLSLGDNAGASSIIPYVVDTNGFIDFPVLGHINVEGLTRRELAAMLTGRISADVKDPIVNISFADYRITILGEVRNPGTYTLPGEKTTIFQALGMAGDLTMAGKRKNVLLLREVDGGYEYAELDLRKTDILSSPYYYMSQNDLVYVAPIASRIQSGTASTTVLQIVGSSISLASLVATMFLVISK